MTTAPKGIDKARVRALVAAGATDCEAAAVLDVTPQAVWWHRQQLGLKGNQSGNRRRWTGAELDRARELMGAGATLLGVAAVIGRTPGALRVALIRHRKEML